MRVEMVGVYLDLIVYNLVSHSILGGSGIRTQALPQIEEYLSLMQGSKACLFAVV